MSYIPPCRHIETSQGRTVIDACDLCRCGIELGRKYVVVDNLPGDAEDFHVCLPCCDCLAACADIARGE